jgi:Flp pilus assembly protein CpaB
MLTQLDARQSRVETSPPGPTVARRPLRSRVSSGHLVMVVAGLLGLLLSLAVLRRADSSVPVLVARRDLAPGTRVEPDLFRATAVHVDPGPLANLVTPATLDGLRGRIVRSPMLAGDLLERSDLAAPSTGAAARSVSFPVDASVAVDGDLTAGDRIDVLASTDDGARSGYVLAGADVVAVHASSSGPLRAGDGQITITVTVDTAGAQRLAGALHGDHLLVVRATGAPAARPTQWFTDAAGDG